MENLEANGFKNAPIRSLDESFGYLLSKAAERITDFHGPIFERVGIIPKQFGILTLLKNEGQLSQIEISRRLGIDRSTMVTLIDNLERKNHVIRTRDSRDRRAYAIKITAAGECARDDTATKLSAAENQMLEPLGSSDIATLKKLLIRLVGQS